MSSSASRSRRRKKTAIVIRAYEASDLDAVAAVFRGPLVVAGTLQTPFRSRAEIERMFADAGPNDRFLVAEVDGEVVAFGGVHVAKSLRRRYSAAVGMMVRDDVQGRGIGGHLLDALLDLGDRWLGVLRFELEVYVDNKRAIALYRSRGFQIEGVARAYALRDGELVDVFHMARVAASLPWPSITAEDVAGRTPPQLTSGPGSSGNGDKKRGRGWN
jgi:putative acetyltransferase